LIFAACAAPMARRVQARAGTRISQAGEPLARANLQAAPRNAAHSARGGGAGGRSAPECMAKVTGVDRSFAVERRRKPPKSLARWRAGCTSARTSRKRHPSANAPAFRGVIGRLAEREGVW